MFLYPKKEKNKKSCARLIQDVGKRLWENFKKYIYLKRKVGIFRSIFRKPIHIWKIVVLIFRLHSCS